MHQPDPIIEEPATATGGVQSSFRRRAITVSLVLHVVLVIVLVSWYLPKRKPAASNSPAGQSSTATDDQASAAKPPPPPAPVADVPAEQIEKSLESQVEQVQKLPDEQKLSELEKNLKRLESVASEESVREVSSTIASTLGLDEGQYALKDVPGEGRFDADTGQLHDVTRTRDPAGGWKYESVLVDSAGHKITVPMTAAEGETVYNTFQQMKKFPFAEGIYRSVVMPLIQKMLEAEQAAQKAANQAARIRPQDENRSEGYETSDD